nr:ribonuclease H-like domain-containing protein [Tanacetum cinerariifolium]
AEGADVELEAEEPDGESSTARDPQFVGGLAPWALRRDLEALRRHERIREAESETSRTEVALLGSEAKIGKIEREIPHYDLIYFSTSMNEFMENMNSGAGGPRGASGSGGAGGSCGTGGNADGMGVRGARPTVPELTGCTYATFINCDPLPFIGTEGAVEGHYTVGQPNLISAGQQNTVSAGSPNPVYAGQPNPVSTGNGIFGPRPLNIQPTSTYFYSFTHNNQQIIFSITHNSLYSLYMTGGLNGKTVVKPSAGWPWTKSSLSTTKGSKINGGSKSKIWSFAKGPLGRPKMENAKDRGIVGSGCSRSMSGNKDKLEYFVHFDGGEVTFGGSTCKISGKGTIKTKNLNFENTHRVLFTKTECLVLSKDFPLPDPSMVILSSPRKHNLYTFSLNELAPQGPFTCLIAKASQNESTLWHMRLGHVNFRNMNKLTEAVATACYVLNRVLVTKPHAKTTYELLTGDKPSISYLKPFGCHVTILNTSESLEKFDKKSDEGYIVGYSISSKAYRVYNLVSRKIEETMNLIFLENKPFIAGTGQAWMFDIDYLTDSLNYSRVSCTNLTAGSPSEKPANIGSQEDDSDSDNEPDVLIIHSTPTPEVPIVDEASIQHDGKEEADRLGLAFLSLNPNLGIGSASIGSSVFAGSTPPISAGSTPPLSLCASSIFDDRHSISAGKSYVPAARLPVSAGRSTSTGRPTDSAGRPVFAGRPSGSAARTPVSTGRILGKVTESASSDRFPRASSVENLDIHDGLTIFDYPKSSSFISSSYDKDLSGPDANNLEISFDKRNNHPDFQLCMFSCFLSQEEPTTVAQALADPDWVEAMQAEMQQFKNQKNKRDGKGIVCRNKARLVAQGHRQEEGIDYTDVFAPVARLEAIRLFLAFASFIGFKVKDWCAEFETLMQSEFEMSFMGPLTFFLGLQVDQRPDGIFIHQEKPDIMFAVCAATRHQVTPKPSHLLSVKWIFKYLTAYPKLGPWYPRDSPFDLEAFSDSDYAAEYVAAASCCGQWLLFTSAGRLIFYWLLVVPAGHISFLLVVSFSCWLTAAAKGKQPARATRPTDPSEVERTEAEQLKILLRRSRQEAHISQHGGSGTDEGTGSKPEVLDVPSDDLEKEISWTTSDDEDVDDQTKGRDDNEGEKTDESDADDQDETEKDDDDNDDDDEEEIAKLDEQEDTYSGEGDAEETESDGESEEEETKEEEEESFDPIPRTPEDDEDDGNGDEDQALRISEEERIQEEEEEEADELYSDVDINQGRGLQVSQDIEDSHMTLTPVQPDGQQESSSVSSFVTSMLNPTSDAGVESIFTTASSSIAPLPTPTPIMTPSTIATITTSNEALM